jgi:uncharacterized phage protein (TIGR02218 family)
MVDWLEVELTTMAFCWRLLRRDGVTLGLTSHDRPLLIKGLTYHAAPGMVPSALERSASFESSVVELSGALSSKALSSSDIMAGRWDGAKLSLFVADWSDPEAETLPLMQGTLGAIRMKDNQFEVELLGPSTSLDAPIIETTSPDCRASLGDKRCGIPMAVRKRTVSMVGGSGHQLTLANAIPGDDFVFGQLRWLDGPNAGLVGTILSAQDTQISLSEAPHFSAMPGDRAELTEGCDRRFVTCHGRFANAANFQGEPHLPGNDLLTRYAS